MHQGQSNTQFPLLRAQGEVSAIPDVAGPLGARDGLLRHHPKSKGSREGKEVSGRARGPGCPWCRGRLLDWERFWQ